MPWSILGPFMLGWDINKAVRQSWVRTMKSILLPVDQSEHMPSALETARLLGTLFDSTVEGVALRPAFAEIVAPDPIVAVTIPPADWSETEFCRNLLRTCYCPPDSQVRGKACRAKSVPALRQSKRTTNPRTRLMFLWSRRSTVSLPSSGRRGSRAHCTNIWHNFDQS